MKRSYQQILSGESDITIKLPDADTLTADRPLLVAASSCARGLPADAAEWDLSGLVVEGQPVSKAVVVAWLDCAYQCILDAPYEEQGKADISTVAGLAKLLAFADAVGSTGGVLKACLSGLDQLRLRARLGSKVLKLKMTAVYMWVDLELQEEVEGFNTTEVAVTSSTNEKASFNKQVAQQTEVLLHIGYKLQLRSLITQLQGFIRNNYAYDGSVLEDLKTDVFSRRVLQAAGSSELGQAAIVDHSLTQRGVLVPGMAAPQLLEPLDLTSDQERPIRFKAKVKKCFLGFSQNQLVEVELDLFGASEVCIAGAACGLQLLVGSKYSDQFIEQRVAEAKQ